MGDTLNELRGEYQRYKSQMKSGFELAIKAIEAIRDQRLYRVEYDTFEDFCQAECAHTRQHINRLIKAVNLMQELEPLGFSIDNERQARALSDLTGEQRRDVLAIAKVTAPEGKVTAAWLESTANVVKAVGTTGGYVDVGDGEMTPLKAAITHETYERAKRQEEHIKAGKAKPLIVASGSIGDALAQVSTALRECASDVRIVVYAMEPVAQVTA